MSEKEEQFPFQQLIGALQGQDNLKNQLKAILKAINQHNIYWTYSCISTIVQINKEKDEDAHIKCRSLQTTKILIQTSQYTVLTLIEIYLLPLLVEIASFKGRKSDELTSYYFQQVHAAQDSTSIRKASLKYVHTAIEIIHLAAKIKPYRTVENQEIKQPSNFATALTTLTQKGVQQPKTINENLGKQLRRTFLEKLKKFSEQSQSWTQFLLVNLLQQIRSNKKQLLQLRVMLSYGQAYLTSSVINLCQDELLDLTQQLEMKRKYLAILHELVRYGDIEAIIMIKNSQFVPMIVAHLTTLQGHLGLAQGENIYPQIKANKQIKRDFYVDFLRCLEIWAVATPQEYDSEEFTLKSLYKLLKEDRKFKFPENIHMNRYQKQLQDNLAKNKERNDKLVEMLENCQDSRQTTNQAPLSKVSNILQRTTLLAPSQLEQRLEQAKRAIKDLLIESKGEKAFKILASFKQNWITYLQALDLQGADQIKIETLIFAGERCVQEIQIITPLYHSYNKGKINFIHFQERVKQALDLQNQLSVNRSQHNKSKSINLSKSLIASKLAKSKMGGNVLGKVSNVLGKSSRLLGKELLDKIKAKSKFADSSQLDLSKIIDRSQIMNKSKVMDRSKKDIMDSKTYEKDNKIINKVIPQPIKTQRTKPQQTKPQPKLLTFSQVSPNPIPPKSQQNQDQHIIRIDDYEVIDKKQENRKSNNRLSHSRERGSKILLRRSQNSKLDKSSQSHQSSQRKSVKSLKRVKQSSISIKSPRGTVPIPIPNKLLAQDEFLHDKFKINQTIEVNGNIIKQGAPTEKRIYKKPQNSFNQFKDGANSISSIHSNSVLRAFHNSAEKILDLTDQIQSERNIREVGEYVTHQPSPPIVGKGQQYYQSSKIEQPQTPKKIPQKMQQQPQRSILPQQSKLKKQTIFQIKRQTPKELSPKRTNNPNIKPKIQQPPSSPSQKQLADRIKQQKDKQIALLQQKIKQLQKQTMMMKTKLAAKDNEIRSIKSSSKHGSQRGHPQFTTLSQSHVDNSSLRGSSVGKSKKVQMSRFESQVQSEFKQYLQRIKGSTFRKSLLKLKCLVHKTDEIQIGCMSHRSDVNLECTLYITPHRYNLIDLSLSVLHDNNMRTKLTPQHIKSLPSKKQQKVHLTIEILKIPFCLPEIEINYKSDSQYSSNYNRLTLPLSFNKFCNIQPLYQHSPQPIQYLRSDNFRYNNKIVKLDKITDSFPNFTVIPPNKERQHILLTAQCTYQGSVFNILLNLHEKNCWIEGFLREGDGKPMNFIICTLKHILDASKK